LIFSHVYGVKPKAKNIEGFNFFNPLPVKPFFTASPFRNDAFDDVVPKAKTHHFCDRSEQERFAKNSFLRNP